MFKKKHSFSVYAKKRFPPPPHQNRDIELLRWLRLHKPLTRWKRTPKLQQGWTICTKITIPQWVKPPRKPTWNIPINTWNIPINTWNIQNPPGISHEKKDPIKNHYPSKKRSHIKNHFWRWSFFFLSRLVGYVSVPWEGSRMCKYMYTVYIWNVLWNYTKNMCAYTFFF